MCRAVNVFNSHPSATCLALKPCCLPNTAFRKTQGDLWEVNLNIKHPILRITLNLNHVLNLPGFWGLRGSVTF